MNLIYSSNDLFTGIDSHTKVAYSQSYLPVLTDLGLREAHYKLAVVV